MEFEDIIVEKQKIKIKANEEIEMYEEEYLGIQEHIVRKQEKVFQLEK